MACTRRVVADDTFRSKHWPLVNVDSFLGRGVDGFSKEMATCFSRIQTLILNKRNCLIYMYLPCIMFSSHTSHASHASQIRRWRDIV